MLLGAHMSIAGGVDKAFERGQHAGCDVIQIFTRNNNQWDAPPLTHKQAAQFIAQKKKTGINCVAAHDCYLINIASPDKMLREKSQQALIDEVERADQLRIPYVVMHPGSHTGSGERSGIKLIMSSLRKVLRGTQHATVAMLLETTAGQGSSIGYTFEQLGEIIDNIREKDRVGVCFDTCHAFAAGYDFRTRKTYRKTFSHFNDVIGLQYLKMFHFNDSKKELGSRVDRHEHIGKGALGHEAFRLILRDKHFKKVPKILETPKSVDMHEDRVNLATLRRLGKA